MERLKVEGFEPWATGGGFYALQKEFDRFYVLITDEDCSIPCSDTEEVYIGFYDEDAFELLGGACKVKVEDINKTINDGVKQLTEE